MGPLAWRGGCGPQRQRGLRGAIHVAPRDQGEADGLERRLARALAHVAERRTDNIHLGRVGAGSTHSAGSTHANSAAGPRRAAGLDAPGDDAPAGEVLLEYDTDEEDSLFGDALGDAEGMEVEGAEEAVEAEESEGASGVGQAAEASLNDSSRPATPLAQSPPCFLTHEDADTMGAILDAFIDGEPPGHSSAEEGSGGDDVEAALRAELAQRTQAHAEEKREWGQERAKLLERIEALEGRVSELEGRDVLDSGLLNSMCRALLEEVTAAVAGPSSMQLFAGGALESITKEQLKVATRLERVWHFSHEVVDAALMAHPALRARLDALMTAERGRYGERRPTKVRRAFLLLTLLARLRNQKSEAACVLPWTLTRRVPVRAQRATCRRGGALA